MISRGKEKELLEEAIRQSFICLYENDKYLIVNRTQQGKKDNHVSERGIVFRFGVYLDNQLKNHFPEYKVDTEYNRNMYEPKYLKGFIRGVYPDLIIHKRGSNEDNLIVFEFKTWWNLNSQNDMEKIKQFTDENGEYKYKYGLLVTLDKEKPILKWIENDIYQNNEEKTISV